MSKSNSYYSNDNDNRAAVALSFFSPDVVDAIISLVKNEGRNLLPVVFGETSPGGSDSGPSMARPLAILSKRFIANRDLEDFALGYATVMLSAIRRPKLGHDEYQAILMTAYDVPSSIASAYASRIDTLDPVANANDPAWVQYGLKVKELARRALNYVPSVLHLPFENDQNQDHDFDILYEIKMLGVIVDELNAKKRLTGAQAMAAGNLSLFLTGDASADETDAQLALVDTLSAISRPKVPSSMLGSMTSLARAGDAANHQAAADMFRAAGYSSDGRGGLETGDSEHEGILKGLLDSVSSMGPGKALLLGAGMGLTPMIIKTIMKGLGHGDAESESGDPNLYGDIAELYGSPLADAWMVGDIDGVMQEGLRIAADNPTTGDPNEDDLHIGEAEAAMGDASDLPPEIGGPFSRFRANMNIRRANRRNRRGRRKQRRIQRRADEAQRLDESRDLRDNAGYIEPPQQRAPFYPTQSQSFVNDAGSVTEFEPSQDDNSSQGGVAPEMSVDSFTI